MLFKFNLYSSLLLPAVVQCLLFASLCFWRFLQLKKQSDLFLALLLIFTGIKLSFWMLGFAGWYDSHDGYTTFMFYFPFNTYLLAGPLVYFYFKSLVNTKFKLSRREWPHMILPVFFILLIIGKGVLDYYFYYPFPKDPNFQYGTRGLLAEADKSLMVTLIAFISFSFYLLLTLRSFPAYRQYLVDNFSDTEALDFGWLKNMLIALSAGIMIFLSFKIIELILGGISYKTDWLSYFALAILSYYISINGYFLQSRQLHHLAFKAAPVMISIDDSADKEWLSILENIMVSTKPYLQPDLSLVDLASMLQTNKTVLSRLVNQYYNKNFNDFINAHRVSEVIAMLKQGRHEQLTLLGIAYDCGFNSKATFNRAFKKVTGQTPKDYIVLINTSQMIT